MELHWIRQSKKEDAGDIKNEPWKRMLKNEN